MKNFTITLALLFISLPLISQTVNEKSIAKVPGVSEIYAYDFAYDKASGNYIYGYYDTVTQQTTVYTQNGAAGVYNSVTTYSAIFDSKGNSYSTAYQNVTDTSGVTHLLVNGNSIGTYEAIYSGWKDIGGIIYMQIIDNGKSYLAKLDPATGKVELGTPYDNLYLVSYKTGGYEEGEPQGEIGVTQDGKVYYVAERNNEKFLVIGGIEQKHYADIDLYNIIWDKSSHPVYIAKSTGKLYEARGNTFVVQGNLEYKSFDYVYGPIFLDNSGMPIYISADSTGEYLTRSRVMTGNAEGKTYTSSIYYLQVLPSGKIAYVGSNRLSGDKFDARIVVDGVEQPAKYSNIGELTFDGARPLYTAYVSDTKVKVMRGSEELSDTYESIYGLKRLPNGMITYVAGKYGNYEKGAPDKFNLFIGDDSFGPYSMIPVADYKTGSYVVTDKSGNYAFIASKLINQKDYIYEQSVVSNKFKSKKFESIYNLYMYNGKIFYTPMLKNEENKGGMMQRIYVNDKELGKPYTSIGEIKFDEATGTISFPATRGNELFWVDVKL